MGRKADRLIPPCMTLTYQDAADDWGDAVNISSAATMIGTVVVGSIRNTTWSTAKAPYLIIGDVTVLSNTTLTIEPGMKVLFLAGKNLLQGGDWGDRSELIINSTLTAKAATSTNPIVFTSSAQTPATQN